MNQTSEDLFDMVNYYAETLDSGRALSVIIPYMDWRHSSELIDSPGINEHVWNNEIFRPRTRTAVKADMRDYMPHAWELVAKRRHESTVEALEHYQIWFDMLGEHSLSEAMKSYGDTDFGATELAIVCQHFGWEYGKMDIRPRLVQ
jgi:hypothetical protein